MSESLRIVADASSIAVIGENAISLRHGVYTLLEKLGFRWFFKHPTWSVVPDTIISLAGLDEVQSPSYIWRRIGRSLYVYPAHEYVSATWNMRNRLFGLKNYGATHTYKDIILIAEYAEHPEYFLPTGVPPVGTVDWQINMDNADVVARAISYAQTQLALPPIKHDDCHDTLVRGDACIGQNDGQGWDPPYPFENLVDWQLVTDKVTQLANDVAKVVKNGHISYWNYDISAGVPSFGLESNLLAVVSPMQMTTLSTYERIDGLSAKGILIGYFDYLDCYEYDPDPPWIEYKQVKNVVGYNSRGVTLYMSDGGDGWCGKGGVMKYLLSKLLWDTSLNADTLLADFYTKAFGPAASKVIEHYYAIRDTTSITDLVVASSFRDLDQAEALAAGNTAVLERIRHLQHYNRWLWKFWYVEIENLALADLEDFYTFITKISDLFIVTYRYAETDLRTELKSRGLSDDDVDALQDFTPPTAEETRTMFDEGLTEFAGVLCPDPFFNPVKSASQALSDVVSSSLDPMHGNHRAIVIPSAGNEDVTVKVKGTGTLQWYDPNGLYLERWSFSGIIEWTEHTFPATVAGNYYVHVTRMSPTYSVADVDVPGRAAGIIATDKDVFDPVTEGTTYDAPSFTGPNEQYFYVPANTRNFSFHAEVPDPDRHAQGIITDPNDVEYEYDFAVTDQEDFVAPTSGLWKFTWNMLLTSAHVWLTGIPSIVWHDPEFLLIPSNHAPVAYDRSAVTNQNAPMPLTLTASDEDDDYLTFVIVTAPSHGILCGGHPTKSGVPPLLTYTPDEDYSGADSFTFYAHDGIAESNLATVSITVSLPVLVPSVPVAVSPGTGREPGSVVSSLTPTLSWGAAAGVLSYLLEVRIYPYAVGDIIYSVAVAGTSKEIPADELVAGAKYRWTVKAINGEGASDYSNPLHFQTPATVDPPVSYLHICKLSSGDEIDTAATELQACIYAVTGVEPTIHDSDIEGAAIRLQVQENLSTDPLTEIDTVYYEAYSGTTLKARIDVAALDDEAKATVLATFKTMFSGNTYYRHEHHHSSPFAPCIQTEV